jgi:hypothetical protein
MMIITNNTRSRSRLSPSAIVRELSKEYRDSRSPKLQDERQVDYSALKEKYLKMRGQNNESYEFATPQKTMDSYSRSLRGSFNTSPKGFLKGYFREGQFFKESARNIT